MDLLSQVSMHNARCRNVEGWVGRDGPLPTAWNPSSLRIRHPPAPAAQEVPTHTRGVVTRPIASVPYVLVVSRGLWTGTDRWAGHRCRRRGAVVESVIGGVDVTVREAASMTSEYAQTDRFRGARMHLCDLSGLEIRD